MTMSRFSARQIGLSFLSVIVLYAAISIFAEQGASLGTVTTWTSSIPVPHNLLDFQHKQTPLESISHNSVPGFERAPPSCRLADLPDDPLVREYGQNNIQLSRTYEGSGYRVRRLLEKALRGEPIKVAAVGGSVSTGHAVKWPHTSENHMHRRVHQWFLDTFPAAKHLLVLDSTVPAVTARFFSYCIHNSLPEDADLVLIELDINHEDPANPSLRSTEALFRTILALPNQPAVIYMSIFALSFKDLTHGWRHSALISQWLDVPEINLRNWMLPHLMLHPNAKPDLFGNWAKDMDVRHVNAAGHKAMGDMVIAYLREQLCLVQRGVSTDKAPENPIWPGIDISQNLPRLGMLEGWNETSVMPILYPKCHSMTSKKFPLKPLSAKGWESVNRNDKKSYEATEIGSEISFKVNVDAGLLGMFYWMTSQKGFGSISCWVDDDKRKDRIRRITAYAPWHQASTFENSGDMWNDLTPGDHVMTCRLEAGSQPEEGNIFRISATVSR